LSTPDAEKRCEGHPASVVVVGYSDGVVQSRSSERKDIVATLKEHGDAMTPKEIAAAIDKSVNSVQVLLHRMAKAGEVVKVDYGRYVLPPVPPCKSVQSVRVGT